MEGSTLDFSGERDEEDMPGQPNFIHLDQLPLADLDYVALGDWHGFVEAGEKAWYSGSHETDRFPKTGQKTGHVAAVRIGRATPPVVEAVSTVRTRWLVHEQTFSSDAGPAMLHDFLNQLTQETGREQMLLRLKLVGSVGLEAHAKLDAMLRSWDAGLLALRLDRSVAIEPSDEEIDALTTSPDAPLTAHVARELVALRDRGGDDADIARTAMALLPDFVRTGGDR
jgi:hypothetical protein